jgi:hypothetical protein
VAAELPLDSVTVTPPEGAAPVSVTVPVEDAPAVTLVGVSTSDFGTGALIASVAVFVTPLAAAAITAGVLAATGTVVIVKVAVVAPAATVTLDGTVAAALLEDNATTTPPDGAALASLTVPVEDAPPVTLVGLTVTELTAGPAARAGTAIQPMILTSMRARASE